MMPIPNSNTMMMPIPNTFAKSSDELQTSTNKAQHYQSKGETTISP